LAALLTPVPDDTDIGELISDKLHGRSVLYDAAGADAIGLVTANPAATTLLGRLKAIQDLLALTNGYVDGLEGLATTLNGLVDGLEALGASGATAALQTTGNASLVTIAGYLDTVETLLAAALPAGENFIGKIGGDVLTATSTPTVSTSAYASGDVIGSKMTLTGMARVAGGAGIVQSIILNSKSAQTGAVDLLLFSADPSSSTFTDNAALSVNAADFDKLIGVAHITDWTNLGTPSVAQWHTGNLAFDLASGTTLYAVLVARSTPTLASTSDLKLTVNVIPG
jgi:hypothetical protein